MGNNIKITADSTCDLTDELCDKYDISIAPLYIIMDGKDHKDGLEISPEDIYKYVDRTGEIPKTAAVSVADYIDIFTKYTQQGKTVVHINISSHFSTCNQNANIAAKEVGNVYVVDSLNLSTGTGLLAIEGAELAREGIPADEIKARLDELAPKVESSFVIETLKYLHMGGRCSSVAALGANLLKLRPCIEVQDGKMNVGKKYRGNYAKCLEQYITDRLSGRDDLANKRIFITHSGCDEEIVATARNTVKKYAEFDEILETIAGCTITSHCGPNTLGILFINKQLSLCI